MTFAGPTLSRSPPASALIRCTSSPIPGNEFLSQTPSTMLKLKKERSIPAIRVYVRKIMEEAGKLKFICVSNDGKDEHMVWLIGLKNIFSRQLPNMLKEYIVRLVLDRNHKSVMVIRRNNVVGGITYRPYVRPLRSFLRLVWHSDIQTDPYYILSLVPFNYLIDLLLQLS